MKIAKIIGLICLIAACSFEVSAQKIPTLKPTIKNSNKYTPAEQKKWEKLRTSLKTVDYDKLSAEEKKMVDLLEDLKGPETQNNRASWYNAGGPKKITASSTLAPEGKFNYKAENAHDFDLFTAWVPSNKKSAIGEKINFYFEANSPRVNEIIIWNGCIYNTELWKMNSRVAKFRLLINGTPTAILELADTDSTQSFSIDPVRSTKGDLVLTLEIMAIYEGTKFKNDVVISEINFSGLDVLCFAAGTEITMADNSIKNIEKITANDWVMVYDWDNQVLTKSKVTNLVTVKHSNLQKLVFQDREIIVTDDHPFWTSENTWASLNAKKSNSNYIQEAEVVQLNIGDSVFVPSENKFVQLLSIEPLEGEQLTYTIETATGDNFIANGLLVKTETVK